MSIALMHASKPKAPYAANANEKAKGAMQQRKGLFNG